MAAAGRRCRAVVSRAMPATCRGCWRRATCRPSTTASPARPTGTSCTARSLRQRQRAGGGLDTQYSDDAGDLGNIAGYRGLPGGPEGDLRPGLRADGAGRLPDRHHQQRLRRGPAVSAGFRHPAQPVRRAGCPRTSASGCKTTSGCCPGGGLAWVGNRHHQYCLIFRKEPVGRKRPAGGNGWQAARWSRARIGSELGELRSYGDQSRRVRPRFRNPSTCAVSRPAAINIARTGRWTKATRYIRSTACTALPR